MNACGFAWKLGQGTVLLNSMAAGGSWFSPWTCPFGGVTQLSDTPRTLFKRFTQAGSRAGLDKVLDILEDKKNPVKYVGLPLLVPWYWMMSDLLCWVLHAVPNDHKWRWFVVWLVFFFNSCHCHYHYTIVCIYIYLCKYATMIMISITKLNLMIKTAVTHWYFN